VASPSSTKTLVRHPWIDPRSQFEQLIERPVSVQPLPDNVHSMVLLTSKGVMVTTSGLLLPSTAVEETVIKAFPEVVILRVKFISPAPVSASTPLVPGIPQLALAISPFSRPMPPTPLRSVWCAGYISVLWDCDGCEDANDRNYGHQLYKGKAVMVLFHEHSLLINSPIAYDFKSIHEWFNHNNLLAKKTGPKARFLVYLRWYISYRYT
jgi:hypothetical protein